MLKEVIRPGTYWYRDEQTGTPRKLVVTPDLCRYWHDQGNAMLATGLTVPVPCEHDFDAHPMTPADKLLNNAGWVKSYVLKGDALFGELDIPDPKIVDALPKTIRWTSPWINSFTDGKGKEWRNVISHLALTTRPRIVNQQPFPSVAAALSMATDVVPAQQRADNSHMMFLDHSKGYSAGEVSSKGFSLSLAGRLTPAGLPEFPVAFSLVTGVVSAAFEVDAGGKVHDTLGQFSSKAKESSNKARNAAIANRGTSKEAHAASMKAGMASHRASDGRRTSHMEAHAAHMEAHAVHMEQQEHHKRRGNHDEARQHLETAKHHREAAKHHLSASKHSMTLSNEPVGSDHDAHRAGGRALSTDASGHQHDAGGKFTGTAQDHSTNARAKTDVAIGAHKGMNPASADKLKTLARRARAASKGGRVGQAESLHRRLATLHRYHADTGKGSSHEKAHRDAANAHESAANAHVGTVSMGVDVPLAVGNKPIPKKNGQPPVDDEDDDFEEDDLDDESEVPDDGDPTNDDNIDLEPLGDPAGDVSMTELLCDLLGALGIQCQSSGNEDQFKRELYNAAMTKIHELTNKGQGQQQNRTNPPGQPPNNPQKQPGAGGQQNPLIQQEQQPMYMSLEDINRLDEPLKSVALSMYNSTVAANAKAEAAQKVLDSLRDAKLKEENDKRARRVALLGKLAPRAKADLDAMLSLPSMALSMGDGGSVVDPMAQTLSTLEKALADIPRLLTADASALSVQAQPTDEGMLTDERVNSIADDMARRMGCAPEAAK